MLIKELTQIVEDAYKSYGIDPSLGQVKRSDRPELSDVQNNGAMQAAHLLKKNPREIAQSLKATLEKNPAFASVSVDGPGFLNFKLSDDLIIRRAVDVSFGQAAPTGKKIMIDYGGPNVAKPLHVGHLRSAIIGESMKRTARNLGHKVIGDIHLGDWGTPMGMLIAYLEIKHPEWPYFKDDFIPMPETEQPPFDAQALNRLYPEAASHFKKDKRSYTAASAEAEEDQGNDAAEADEDAEFTQAARLATAKLQAGHPGYRALWRHFVNLSLSSIKDDFSELGVDFDLWLGESDADSYIDAMVKDLMDRGIAQERDGAIVIDVAEPEDKEKIYPLILRKKDGAVTYGTTDLATIFQRVQDYQPDNIFYVVDKRQSQHFVKVFRAAALAGYAQDTKLEHTGFGTMNGADGKPFKTRAGGVMRLAELIRMSKKLAEDEAGFAGLAYDDDIKRMLGQVAIAAIKFGDLVNPRSSDYNFNPQEFVRFEGKTGPYVQYTTVRAKAILEKTPATNGADAPMAAAMTFTSPYERDLALKLIEYTEAKQESFDRRLPSDLCLYVYELSRKFNGFYKNCPVASEENADVRELRIMLTKKTVGVLSEVLDLLAIPIPTKMERAEQPQRAAPAFD